MNTENLNDYENENVFFDELAELDDLDGFIIEDYINDFDDVQDDYDDSELMEDVVDDNEAVPLFCPECGAEPGELHSCGIINED